MTKAQVFEIAYRQLAIDYNTTPEALRAGGLIFTRPAMNPERRVYSDKLPFFEMVTTGTAAVIMAEEGLWPALREWAGDAEEPHWLMEFPRMRRLAEILSPYGYALTQTFHHYLPTRDFEPVGAPEGFSLRWLERREIGAYYPNESWLNALQAAENPARPDMLALLALDGDRPAAMAGASADSPSLWQVGIDVLPGYRGRGLGSLLVEGLSHEVARRGAVPFYGTSLSNIHSQNIAWKCGFRPAWVGVSAKKEEFPGRCVSPENLVRETFPADTRGRVLKFLACLRAAGAAFERCGGYWAGQYYWMVSYLDEPVFYLLVNGTGDEARFAPLTVWTDDSGSLWLEDVPLDGREKELCLEHVDVCEGCGSCSGGRVKTICGREFEDVCRTALRFVDPGAEELELLQRLAELRLSDIKKYKEI